MAPRNLSFNSFRPKHFYCLHAHDSHVTRTFSLLFVCLSVCVFQCVYFYYNPFRFKYKYLSWKLSFIFSYSFFLCVCDGSSIRLKCLTCNRELLWSIRFDRNILLWLHSYLRFFFAVRQRICDKTKWRFVNYNISAEMW